MDRRFTALRVIGTVFKILAWISLILGLIAAVAMLILGFTLSGQAGLLGLELGSSLAGIAMFVVLLIIAIFGFSPSFHDFIKEFDIVHPFDWIFKSAVPG